MTNLKDNAAKILVALVAVIEAVYIADWLRWALLLGTFNASTRVHFSSLYILGLPILAALISQAKSVSLVAFAEYGVALLFNVLSLVAFLNRYLQASVVEWDPTVDAGPSALPVQLDVLVYGVANVVLCVLGVLATWQVFKRPSPA